MSWSAIVLSAMLAASSAGAQDRHLPPGDVAQIADGALRIVVPQSLSVTGISLEGRTIAFDARATLDAFGDSTAPDSALRLPRSVDIAPRGMLHDCSQIAPQPCAGIGSRTYVAIEPVSVARSRAHVRVTVLFATRMHGPDGALTNNAFLSGYSKTLWFVRDGDDVWRFVSEDSQGVIF